MIQRVDVHFVRRAKDIGDSVLDRRPRRGNRRNLKQTDKGSMGSNSWVVLLHYHIMVFENCKKNPNSTMYFGR